MTEVALRLAPSRFRLDTFRTFRNDAAKPKPLLCPVCGHGMSHYQESRAGVCSRCEDAGYTRPKAAVGPRSVVPFSDEEIWRMNLEGLSQRQIAARLGVTKSAIQWRIDRYLAEHPAAERKPTSTELGVHHHNLAPEWDWLQKTGMTYAAIAERYETTASVVSSQVCRHRRQS